MQPTIHTARQRGHLSRHERQRRARAEAFSRRTPAGRSGEVPVKLGRDELELIERLVRHDRTAVSSALLVIAGIGASEAIRGAVLTQLSEAASWAQAKGAISPERSGADRPARPPCLERSRPRCCVRKTGRRGRVRD